MPTTWATSDSSVQNTFVASLSNFVRSSPLHRWLLSCNTQRIDLGQYAQNIHNADIGMDSLQVLHDDAVLTALIPNMTHRTLMKLCIKDHLELQVHTKIEEERVRGLLLHSWILGSVIGIQRERLVEIVKHLDQHGIGMQTLDMLLHDGISKPLIPREDERTKIVAAVKAYREQSQVHVRCRSGRRVKCKSRFVKKTYVTAHAHRALRTPCPHISALLVFRP